MDAPTPVDQSTTAAADTQLTYVVIRVRRQSAGMNPQLTGIAERIGSAEKRSFADAEALVRLIEEWSVAPRKT